MRAGSPRLLREINDRAAIEILLDNGPMTRSELETAIGLSKPATAQLLARLEEDDVVRREGLRGGARGPRAQLWAVNGALCFVAAVDLTAESVDIAIADISGRVLAEHRAVMPAGPTEAVLAAFDTALTAAVGLAGLPEGTLRHVVVGSPGAVDRATGQLGFAPHLPGWEGFDLPGRLSELLNATVTVENDVNLVALEEMISGKAVDVRDMVLVWPADAVGSAVVVNRVLLRGATGGAGEIDWMRVPDLAKAGSAVGRDGIRFGDLVSSDSIVSLAAAHGVHAETGIAAVRAAVTGGDPGIAFLTDLARRIATGVANLVSVLDPELVLLSGETAETGGELLCELVQRELHELVIPKTPVELGSVTGNAVRAGALHSAYAIAREEIFGLPAAEFMKPPGSRAHR
ncbi:ROK family transcriptional regulator [Crossiella cryophila]|uniref:Putative NBD/HSP70 family sugar kinase n=1 Tax=Crossiella cryophila TaxID=43355 RepID=A0A7W7CL89_9PSEU|nr:ROK family transcriptional regulator [Crossiella cryophila]MBB4681529.1 putative NBD/HSP70 family sugar kinase [Crossiella cryophila]